jgi:hypothetical protein
MEVRAWCSGIEEDHHPIDIRRLPRLRYGQARRGLARLPWAHSVSLCRLLVDEPLV